MYMQCITSYIALSPELKCTEITFTKCFLLFLFFSQIILDQFQYFSFYKNDKIVLFF